MERIGFGGNNMVENGQYRLIRAIFICGGHLDLSPRHHMREYTVIAVVLLKM